MSESMHALDESIRDLRSAALRRLAHIRGWMVSDNELRDLVGRHTDDEVVAQLRSRARKQPPPTTPVVAESETIPKSRWRFWHWGRRRTRA